LGIGPVSANRRAIEALVASGRLLRSPAARTLVRRKTEVKEAVMARRLMPRDVQRAVRARKAVTGEQYMVAAERLQADRDDPDHEHTLTDRGNGVETGCVMCGLDVRNVNVSDAITFTATASVGRPTITTERTIAPQGIPSAEAFGTPTVTRDPFAVNFSDADQA
jgi:hypothetical protein